MTENLFLQFNCLTSPLDHKVFEKLNNLGRLDLSHNQLEFIDDKTFRPLKRLKHLFLGHNRIRRLDESVFADLNSLIELNLAHNIIDREDDLPSGIFHSLKNLCELKFSGNGLAKKTSFDFRNKYFPNHDKHLHIYLNES